MPIFIEILGLEAWQGEIKRQQAFDLMIGQPFCEEVEIAVIAGDIKNAFGGKRAYLKISAEYDAHSWTNANAVARLLRSLGMNIQLARVEFIANKFICNGCQGTGKHRCEQKHTACWCALCQDWSS